jgi:signal transduction histidine kinase
LLLDGPPGQFHIAGKKVRMQTPLPFEVIGRLYGYAAGALIQFILLVLLKRHFRTGVLERRLLVLLGGFFVWFFSNFMALSLRANFALNPKWVLLIYLYQLFESLSFFSIALIPSLLLDCHLHMQRRLLAKPLIPFHWSLEVAIFLPVLGASLAYRDLLELIGEESSTARGFSLFLAAGSQRDTQDFGTSLFAYSSYAPYFAAWFIAVLLVCLSIEWKLRRELSQASARKMFSGLMTVFGTLVVLLLMVFFISTSYENTLAEYRSLEAFLRLWPILPGGIVGYFTLRFNFLGLAIQRRAIYLVAFFVALLFYQFLKDHLAYRYNIYAFTVDFAAIILVLIFFRPVKSLLDRLSNALFSEEISRFQKITSRLEEASRATPELQQLIPFMENFLERELEFSRISICLFEPGMRAHSSLGSFTEGEKNKIGLYKEETLIGEICFESDVHPSRTLNPETLYALVPSLVAAIETCRLAEEKVRLEKELAQQEKFAALGQMAATVAHNIKNPLSSIKTLVQLVREDQTITGRCQQDLNMMDSEIDRLSGSVSHLLEFSKTAVISLVSLDLCEVLKSVNEFFSSESQKHRIRLKVECPQKALMVQSNREVLLEILQNLVVNAMEAISGVGEITLKAREESSKGRAWVIISVEDNGRGIPPEIQPNLFKPFFTTKTKGSGLGLAIVQRRVLELGGQIEWISPVHGGCGTRFEVSFPAVAERRSRELEIENQPR